MEEIKDYPPYLDYPKPCKPQTRADKIRAMNNEELAAILGEACKGITDCVDCPFYSSGCPMSSSFKDWMDWLQQPCEGGE